LTLLVLSGGTCARPLADASSRPTLPPVPRDVARQLLHQIECIPNGIETIGNDGLDLG